MHITNVHSRRYPIGAARIGEALSTLSSSTDRIWPTENWPAMKIDGPLAVGATGGHKPIGYMVEAYEPHQFIRFRFTYPKGFKGTHQFKIIPLESEVTELNHTIDMQVSGVSWLTWMLVIRPLHNALTEDALTKLGADLGHPAPFADWPLSVKFLRWVMAGGKARPKKGRAGERT